ERALRGFANRGVRLEEELFQRLTVLIPLLELDRLGGELFVAQLLELGLEAGDVLSLGLEALEAPALAHPQDLFEAAEILCHETFRVASRARRPGLPRDRRRAAPHGSRMRDRPPLRRGARARERCRTTASRQRAARGRRWSA